jgi:hypothetical protein
LMEYLMPELYQSFVSLPSTVLGISADVSNGI